MHSTCFEQEPRTSAAVYSAKCEVRSGLCLCSDVAIKRIDIKNIKFELLLLCALAGGWRLGGGARSRTGTLGLSGCCVSSAALQFVGSTIKNYHSAR